MQYGIRIVKLFITTTQQIGKINCAQSSVYWYWYWYSENFLTLSTPTTQPTHHLHHQVKSDRRQLQSGTAQHLTPYTGDDSEDAADNGDDAADNESDICRPSDKTQNSLSYRVWQLQ